MTLLAQVGAPAGQANVEWVGWIIVAALVMTLLWPWFILAALNRMSRAQERLARGLTNEPGRPSQAESMARMAHALARLADAEDRKETALARLAAAHEALAPAPRGEKRKGPEAVAAVPTVQPDAAASADLTDPPLRPRPQYETPSHKRAIVSSTDWAIIAGISGAALLFLWWLFRH